MVHPFESDHRFRAPSCQLQFGPEPEVWLPSGRNMAQIIVERSFETPTVLAEIQALEDAVAWCLEKYEVRFDRTFLSLDRRHMVCFYDAPDAEAVRRTQREGKLPFDRIWTGSVFTAESPTNEEDFEHVIVQRAWPSRVDNTQMNEMMASSHSCLGIYRAYIQSSYLSADGMRTICHFRAPDAESVRVGNIRGGVPFERAWASSLHFSAKRG